MIRQALLFPGIGNKFERRKPPLLADPCALFFASLAAAARG